jgi:hypothetical protein
MLSAPSLPPFSPAWLKKLSGRSPFVLFTNYLGKGKWALQRFRKNSCVSGRKPWQIESLMLEGLLQGPSRKKLTPKFSLLKMWVISQKEVIPGVSACCAHH